MSFTFQMDDLPEQILDVEKASIDLFRPALTDAGTFGLLVMVVAKPVMVTAPDAHDGDAPHRIAPTYYTEWLDIPISALVSRDAACLNGYVMEYGGDQTDTGRVTQSPAAIQNDSHALLEHGSMSLHHLGGDTYQITAEGKTEFGWTFSLATQGSQNKLRFRDDNASSPQEPDPAIEKEFARFFDAGAFNAKWHRLGSEDFGWHDFIAEPKGSDQ